MRTSWPFFTWGPKAKKGLAKSKSAVQLPPLESGAQVLSGHLIRTWICEWRTGPWNCHDYEMGVRRWNLWENDVLKLWKKHNSHWIGFKGQALGNHGFLPWNLRRSFLYNIPLIQRHRGSIFPRHGQSSGSQAQAATGCTPAGSDLVNKRGM